MHDPMTVAFAIKYPWKTPFYRTTKDGLKPLRMRLSFITIWHVDPEKPCKHGNRSDDSCGWFTPPTTPEQRERVRKIGREEFAFLFRRRHQEAAGDPEGYADICYEPSVYDAVYWSWWHIKYRLTGRRRLARGELDYIYSLASNPVDNLRCSFLDVRDEESCADFFMIVYRAYLRHHRPWWRHPRWHFWHWKLQIHPWQQLRRRLFDRCAHCGKPFIRECPTSFQWGSKKPKWFRSAEGLYHSKCAAEVTRGWKSDSDQDGKAATGLDVPGAIIEKNGHNMVRDDHKLEARRAGGKRY